QHGCFMRHGNNNAHKILQPPQSFQNSSQIVWLGVKGHQHAIVVGASEEFVHALWRFHMMYGIGQNPEQLCLTCNFFHNPAPVFLYILSCPATARQYTESILRYMIYNVLATLQIEYR